MRTLTTPIAPGRLQRTFTVLAIFQLLFCYLLLAQSDTATLSGRITDASGEMIPAVDVLVTHADSGLQTPTLTNEQGVYVVLGQNVVPGVPFYVPDPTQPGGQRLNAAAFATPVNGSQGDLPRNYFRGFPIDQTDLAVSRRFGLSERLSLFFRVEYFNIFNHPMFAPPTANFNNSLWNPRFGRITATLNNYLRGTGSLSPLYEIGGPRSGQLTLKLEF